MDLRLDEPAADGRQSARRSTPCSARRTRPGSARERGADGHFAHGGHAARAQRHLLLPALHAVQARVGWISPAALGYVCRRLTIPPGRGLRRRQLLRPVRARAAGAAWSPTSAPTSPACAAAASELVAELERTVGPARRASRRTARRSGSRAPASACASALRRCWSPARARPPGDHSIGAGDRGGRGRRRSAGPSAARAAAHRWCRRPAGDGLRLLRRVGRVDPESLDSYRSARRLRGAATRVRRSAPPA